MVGPLKVLFSNKLIIMMKTNFEDYFFDVLLNDQIYLELCDKLGTLCMENIVDDYVQLSEKDEKTYQQLSRLRNIRYDYILSKAFQLYMNKN